VQAAAKRARLGKDYDVRVIEPDLSFTEQFLLNARGAYATVLHSAGLGSSRSLAAQLRTELRPELAPLERELARWQSLAATPQHAVAYCFCEVD